MQTELQVNTPTENIQQAAKWEPAVYGMYTLKVTRGVTSPMTLFSSALMRNVPQEDGDVTRVTSVEKHRHYEEGHGQSSYARGQELVQAFARTCQMKRRVV